MSPAWPALSVIGGEHSEMPLTPASQRKIQLIVEKNAERGGRAAVIKYVQQFSKGKPGRPSHGADKASWWEVKQLIDGKSLSAVVAANAILDRAYGKPAQFNSRATHTRCFPTFNFV